MAIKKTKIVTLGYLSPDKPGQNTQRISIKRTLAPANLPEAPPGIVSNHCHDPVRESDLIGTRAPAG